MSDGQPSRAVIYLGPSLDREEASALAPGAEIRPPVRRGDLYRDRLAGTKDFLILDGVFFQQEALPPREILDVMADGAAVHGACSLGALRAADCAPAGMTGSGLIYRLFRAGVLGSDDEVAIVFDRRSGKALSVPLVNVRWAARRLERRGRLTAKEAERWVQTAARLHYSARTWPAILDEVGEEANDKTGLVSELDALDLKARDARQALTRLAERLASGLGTGSPRRSERPLGTTGEREQAHAVPAGADPSQEKIELARDLLLGGRYARYLATLGAAFPEFELAEGRRAQVPVASLLARGFPEAERAAAGSSTALRLALVDLWIRAGRRLPDFADALWTELQLAGELDAERIRRRAVEDGAEASRRRGFDVDARHLYLATTEILQEHGLSSWSELRRLAEATAFPWKAFVDHRDRSAAAKCWRDHLFRHGVPGPKR